MVCFDALLRKECRTMLRKLDHLVSSEEAFKMPLQTATAKHAWEICALFQVFHILRFPSFAA